MPYKIPHIQDPPYRSYPYRGATHKGALLKMITYAFGCSLLDCFAATPQAAAVFRPMPFPFWRSDDFVALLSMSGNSLTSP